MEEFALQEKYSPQSACFGCGPVNPKGLKIRSIPRENAVYANWTPEPHHEAFPGILCGGIIGTLLDCHSNWTAAWHLMQQMKAETPPCTVTAEFNVKLLRPTPTDGPVELKAFVLDSTDDRATIQAELRAKGKLCATCKGIFVAVKPGHPAYHRW